MNFRRFALTFLVVFAAVPAVADEATDKRFQAYVTSKEYSNVIGQFAVLADSLAMPSCKEHAPRERADLTIFTAPGFGGAEDVHPNAGMWRDRVKMSQCGKTSYQNIMVQAQAGKPPKFAFAMPGLTAANPPLQDVVMHDIVEQFKKAGCTDLSKVVPVDSKQADQGTPRRIDERGMLVEGSWKETWVMRGCSKVTNFDISFAADGKGGMNHQVTMVAAAGGGGKPRKK